MFWSRNLSETRLRRPGDLFHRIHQLIVGREARQRKSKKTSGCFSGTIRESRVIFGRGFGVKKEPAS